MPNIFLVFWSVWESKALHSMGQLLKCLCVTQKLPPALFVVSPLHLAIRAKSSRKIIQPFPYHVMLTKNDRAYQKYVVEQKKAPTEQVYINDEEENIIKVALKTSDFSETLVHIQRTEIRHYDKLDNGEIVRNGYEVVPHGKTPNADRELFLTRNAKAFLSLIVNANEERNFHSEYLLLNKDGERMHNDAVNNVFKRVQNA